MKHPQPFLDLETQHNSNRTAQAAMAMYRRAARRYTLLIAEKRVGGCRIEVDEMEEELLVIQLAAARLDDRAAMLDTIEQLNNQLGDVREQLREKSDEIAGLRRAERLVNLEERRTAAKARRIAEKAATKREAEAAAVEAKKKEKLEAAAASKKRRRAAEVEDVRKAKQRQQKAASRRNAAVAAATREETAKA